MKINSILILLIKLLSQGKRIKIVTKLMFFGLGNKKTPEQMPRRSDFSSSL